MRLILRILLSTFIFPLIAVEQDCQRQLAHHVIDSLNFVEGDFSLEQAVDDLNEMRMELVRSGYDTPLLSEVFEHTFDSLEEKGIVLDLGFCEEFYATVLAKEGLAFHGISQLSQRGKFSSKMIFQAKNKNKKKRLKFLMA